MVKARVTFRRDITEVSIHDDVKGEWCEENGKPIHKIDFKAGDTASFPCQREGDSPYCARISITSEKENFGEDYTLKDNENAIYFPSGPQEFMQQFQQYPNFEKFAEDLVKRGGG